MAGMGSDYSEPSPRRALIWAALTFAMAGAAGGTGYLVAAATEDATAQPLAHHPLLSSNPGLVDVQAVYNSGFSAGGRGPRKSALARGRREGRKEERVVWQRRLRRDGPTYRHIYEAGVTAGSRQTLARFAFADDGFYAVGVAQRGLEVNATYGPLRDGDAYRLCDDGTALCSPARQGGRP